MNLHISPRTIYFARVRVVASYYLNLIFFIFASSPFLWCKTQVVSSDDLKLDTHARKLSIQLFLQNGEALNETYRADAELSEQGHRYAENLKNYLLSYRERNRIMNPEEKERPLTVSSLRYDLMWASRFSFYTLYEGGVGDTGSKSSSPNFFI